MLVDIRKILEEVMNSGSKRKAFDEALVRRAWPQAVGKSIASKAEPQALRGKVLYVSTQSPVWAQELAALEREVVSKINATMGREAVKAIRFRGRGGPEQKVPPPPAKRQIELDGGELAEIKNVAQGLPDGDLKDRLMRLMVRDRRQKKNDGHL